MRVTVQALAAVLGGTQSLHTNGYDEALALPTAESATLALRTQQILGYESGTAKVVDPLAGSYYVEALTDAHRGRRARAHRRGRRPRRRGEGDRARVLPGGHREKRLRAPEGRQESGERVVVGVNRFTDDAPPPDIETPDFSALETRQRARLAEARARRDVAAVASTLAALRTAAEATTPLMPSILAAVRARATLGEISDSLRQVWGVYRPA